MDARLFPYHPTTVHNDTDGNITAPSGEVIPPGATVLVPGATLRDYFAAQALVGLIARIGDAPYGIDRNAVTRSAYTFADAMLKARGAA